MSSPAKGLLAETSTRPANASDGIRVVVASPDFSKRKGLARCFSKEAGFVLVHCSNSLDDIFSCCQKLAPCVLMIDQQLAEKVDSAEFGSAVGFGRVAQVLVVGPGAAGDAIENILRMGCMGFLEKGCSDLTLRQAVRVVASGELWASRRVISRLVQEFLMADSPRKLTRREQEILTLIAQGHKNQEIAAQLYITRETVRWHVRSLYAKIGVEDRLGATLYAVHAAKQAGQHFQPAPELSHRPLDGVQRYRQVLSSPTSEPSKRISTSRLRSAS